MNLKQIADIFRNFADKIENNTCEIDSETLEDIANGMIHIKLTAEQAASYLNVSRATFSRMVWDGRVPPHRKDRGGNRYWYRDEIDESLRKYREKHGE